MTYRINYYTIIVNFSIGEKITMKNIAKSQKIQPGALNESQAAIYVGVSPSTMAKWRKEGVGPRYKPVVCPGAEKPRYLYPVKLLDEWLESAVVTA